MSIRVVIADDHKLMREGLRALLSEEANMSVVGEAKDGEAAVRETEQARPDVLLMDISMPGLNGIEATRRIRAAKNAPRIMALSMHARSDMVVEILSAGATGYLLKDCAFEEVTGAIEQVASGNVYLSENIVGAVVQEYHKRVSPEQSSRSLSKKETKLLHYMAEQKTVGDIAALLDMSEGDVKSNQQRILQNFIIPALSRIDKTDTSCPEVNIEISSRNAASQSMSRGDVSDEGVRLTHGEKKVMYRIKEGKSIKETAGILNISVSGVKFHLQNIYPKLKARKMSQAIAIAIEKKLLDD